MSSLAQVSSLAQEESRSISLNTTWGHRKRFSDGSYSVVYNSFLGYDKGKEGKLVVNKKQAETIKIIYKMYLLGKSLYGIKQELERLNLETPMHKKVWHSNDKYRCVIYRCNKKYNGKKCSTDHVTEDEIKAKFVEAYKSLDRNEQ